MDETIWLTREQAAEWLNVCVSTVTAIAREMDEFGFDGIWREGRSFLRINKKAMSEYLFQRRRLKYERKRYA